MEIVFILNNNHKLRYFKRIEEFIARGYAIKVCSFSRMEGDARKLPVPVNIIGEFNNSWSYFKRLKTIIGELTLSAGNGNLTEDYYNHLGDLTDITLLKQIK